MDVGTVSNGFKWIVDVNHDNIPERSEVGKKAEADFSLPLTDEDCAALGMPLTEEYSLQNVNDLIVIINKVNGEAALLFQNADQLFKQKNYPAAQTEFDRAAVVYTNAVELYSVLISIAQRQPDETYKAALSGFIKNSETAKQNLKIAQSNSAAAAVAQLDLIFAAEDELLLKRYSQAVTTYNDGVAAYNAKHFTEALTAFTQVAEQCTELLKLFSEDEMKYPQQQFTLQSKDIQDLLTEALKIKEETSSKIK